MENTGKRSDEKVNTGNITDRPVNTVNTTDRPVNTGNVSHVTPPNYMLSEEDTLRRMDQMVEVCNTMSGEIPGVKIGMVLGGGDALGGMGMAMMTMGAMMGGMSAMRQAEREQAEHEKKNAGNDRA